MDKDLKIFEENMWKYGVIKRRLFMANDRPAGDDFGLLVPGEYIAIVATHGREDTSEVLHISHGKFIIVKVISVKKRTLWNGGGSAFVEFHDGTKGEINHSYSKSDTLWRYFSKEKYLTYQSSGYGSWLEVYSFTDLTHLKNCMTYLSQCRIEFEKQKIEQENRRRQLELQQRQREEELRRRNNSVSAGELDKLFRS